MQRAHPRSRGENSYAWMPSSSMYGSSPLTRGKRPARQPRAALRGLIPAHAGKTASRLTRVRSGRAHPRSRGENPHPDVSLTPETGSSPLTRGKRPQRDTPIGQSRLIPAHAGKTEASQLPRQSPKAHPRSRGENDLCQVKHAVTRGSSPLTRGKQAVIGGLGEQGRLIPAHAGKTHGKAPT